MSNGIISSLLMLITVMQLSVTPELYVRDVRVSAGTFNDRIIVEWQGINNGSYRILRSSFTKTGFTEVAVTDGTKFEDRDIKSGVVYWYRIVPSASTDGLANSISDDKSRELFIDEEEYNKTAGVPCQEISSGTESDNREQSNSSGITTSCFSGYASNDPAPGEDIDKLIKEKKSVLKVPKDNREKAVQAARLKYLAKYYMHPVKFSLIITLARPYLGRGEILIFRGNDFFEIHREQKEFVFHDPDYKTYIVFQSKKFLKLIDESKDSGLTELLVKNAEIFCIPRGKKMITDIDGVTRVVNYYDALGLSTRYLKDDREWKSRTIMISTSRKDLKEMLKNVSRPEE